MTENNPFAPPKAQVLDRNQDVSGLTRQSVWITILLTFVTFGIYYPVWFLRRRPGLNRLNSPKKLALWPLLLFVSVFVTQILAGVLAGAAGEGSVERALGFGPAFLLQCWQIAVGILMIVQCFKIKDIIEDHATPEGDTTMFAEQVKLSGLMTFFFSLFYLQWAINRYVVGTDGAKSTSA